VATCYSLGYVVAVFASRPWLKWLETTNVFTAFVVLAVLLALFSPIADPARISVADQVARLEAGAISPDQFDFAFLRFRSGRFGLDALERLKAKQDGKDATRIADRTRLALLSDRPADVQRQPPPPPITSQQRAARLKVIYPKGAALPETFLQQDWSTGPQRYLYPGCLTASVAPICEAMMVDLYGDGSRVVIVVGEGAAAPAAFKQSGNQWTLLGNLTNTGCKGVREALREGKFEIEPPD
jgi:hypothetical protein